MPSLDQEAEENSRKEPQVIHFAFLSGVNSLGLQQESHLLVYQILEHV